jgi:hypothetical protein
MSPFDGNGIPVYGEDLFLTEEEFVVNDLK